MQSLNQIKIEIDREMFIIKQNEFWYFSNMLKKISNYFKIKDNRSKTILLKIPGTGKFKQVDYLIFNRICNQVDNVINNYKNEVQIV
tara:strand:- start:976 stop:1236 length:261 start_codon:yes stop_codon:yes gene_type:complete